MIPKKILICGGTGFIGRNAAEHLSGRHDFEVSATYFNSPPFEHPRITWHQADLRDAAQIDGLVRGKDIIIQAAAITSGAKDIVSRSHIHVTDNVVMNSLIFRAAFEHQVGHLLFPSCSIMYPSADKPLKETDLDLAAEMNPKYFGAGWTKVYEEKMCEFFSRSGKTKFTAFRHSNIYGPHDKFDLDKSHVFAATLVKVMTTPEGGSVVVWGNGEERRDLLYVFDLVRFIEMAIDKQTTPFELVNVGLGEAVSVRDLVELIIKASGKRLQIEFDPSKPTIQTSLALDCTKARGLFGWAPRVTLADGVRETLQWYREHIE